VADVAGVTLKFVVVDVNVVDLQGLDQIGEASVSKANDRAKPNKGILMKKSRVYCVKAPNSLVKVTGSEGMGGTTLKFRPDWNFEQMGIGGLDAEFSDIFRRAFASR
jgi:vesicle-fusing ATPase